MREFFNTVEVDGFLEKPCEEADLLNKIRKVLARRSGGAAAASTGKKRILLAEDDASVANRVSEAFIQAGYEVEVVQSGPEVLERAAVVKPHLILMKEILPRLNGSAAASLIEVMPSVSMVPVILYDETRAGAADAGTRRSDLKCVRRMLVTSVPAELVKAAKEVL